MRGVRSMGGDLGVSAGAQPGDVALYVRRVADLLKGSPVTCAPTASVGAAARLMTERSVGSVIVSGPDGPVAGILTDRDLRASAWWQRDGRERPR